MSQWEFILIDRDGNRTEVSEPMNWEDPEVSVSRELDNDWHGTFFDYGLDKLTFDGVAAELLKAEYETYGVNGRMHMDILFKCSEDSTYDIFYEGGRMAFDQYSDTCGDECTVSIGIETSEDVMLFLNNYEQPVNLNSNIAFDQSTVLTNYDRLDYDQEIPSRGLPQTAGGKSPGAEHSIYPIDIRLTTPITGTAIRIRPELTEDSISEIAVSDPTGENSYAVFPQTDPNLYPTGISPLIIPAERTTCSNGLFNYKIRLKGHIREVSDISRDIRIIIYVINQPWADIGDPALHELEILSETHYEAGGGPDMDFDVSWEGSTFVDIDDPFVTFINFVTFYGSVADQQVFVDWDEETSVKVETVMSCDPSVARCYMINEAISRVTEAVTNDKIRFYSETFGRKDSQPYAINYNPCPGLFTITNGLNLRRKLLINNQRPGLFLSLKDCFDGLNPLWNIGLTIEPDPNRVGYKRLRFENWRYFYQDDIALWFNYPTKITRECDPTRLFNQLRIGYNKWQAEGTTGLYELMTKRQYRIDVNSESNVLEKYTEFICSPFTIEITRRKNENTEDWQYDNDTFGFCLKYTSGEYTVETFLDNATEVSNVIDPNSCYNGKISPVRMAMRWFDRAMQGLRIIYPNSKLIFSKADGNYVAKFKTAGCGPEGKAMSENEDIDLTDFEDLEDARPITFADLVTFDHPMNYNTFKRIKDDPTIRYKTFGYRCNGTEYEGWLDELRYKPITGMATITLIPKNKTIIVAPPEPECLAEVANLVFTPNGDGFMLITWDATVAGATFWQFIVTKDGQPFQTLNVTDTSFQYANLLPGNYSVTVIPFCDIDFPGANYVQGTFDIEEPTFAITLSAILTTGRQPNNKMQLTATSNVAATSGFSFKFGQCTFNTSAPSLGEACASFPGSTFPPPSYPGAVMSFNVGDQNKMVESLSSTPGADFGYISKVVLYDLVGIAPAQITKAVGQTWDLEFI